MNDNTQFDAMAGFEPEDTSWGIEGQPSLSPDEERNLREGPTKLGHNGIFQLVIAGSSAGFVLGIVMLAGQIFLKRQQPQVMDQSGEHLFAKETEDDKGAVMAKSFLNSQQYPTPEVPISDMEPSMSDEAAALDALPPPPHTAPTIKIEETTRLRVPQELPPLGDAAGTKPPVDISYQPGPQYETVSSSGLHPSLPRFEPFVPPQQAKVPPSEPQPTTAQQSPAKPSKGQKPTLAKAKPPTPKEIEQPDVLASVTQPVGQPEPAPELPLPSIPTGSQAQVAFAQKMQVLSGTANQGLRVFATLTESLVSAEGTPLLSRNDALIAEISAVSGAGLVQAPVVAMVKENVEYPVPKGHMMLRGLNGTLLMAQHQDSLSDIDSESNDDGPREHVLERIALGGIRSAAGSFSNPTSINISNGQNGISSTITSAGSSIVSNVLGGMAEEGLDIIDERLKAGSKPSKPATLQRTKQEIVWQMPSVAEVYVNASVTMPAASIPPLPPPITQPERQSAPVDVPAPQPLPDPPASPLLDAQDALLSEEMETPGNFSQEAPAVEPIHAPQPAGHKEIVPSPPVQPPDVLTPAEVVPVPLAETMATPVPPPPMVTPEPEPEPVPPILPPAIEEEVVLPKGVDQVETPQKTAELPSATDNAELSSASVLEVAALEMPDVDVTDASSVADDDLEPIQDAVLNLVVTTP